MNIIRLATQGMDVKHFLLKASFQGFLYKTSFSVVDFQKGRIKTKSICFSLNHAMIMAGEHLSYKRITSIKALIYSIF